MGLLITKRSRRPWGMPGLLEHVPVHEHPRARVVMFTNACAFVITLIWPVLVLTHESYEGARTLNMCVTLVVMMWIGLNHEVARRGHLATAMYSLGLMVLVGVTTSSLSTGALHPSFWLLMLTGLTSFFATHPVQVFSMAALTFACAAFCKFSLSGSMPEEFLHDEIARTTISCMVLMALALMKTQLHLAFSRQLRDNHEATAQAALQAEHQRARLLEALAQARQEDRRRSIFLESMSHELRTPLNAILGYTELLHEEVLDQASTLPDTVRDDASTIQVASHHLLELIDEVLDLDELGHEQIHLKASSFDLVEHLNEVCVAMRPAASQRGNQLLFTHAHPTLTLRQEPTLLRQLMFNFISNAIKFTTHGTIEVELLAHRPRNARIRIMDTGTGMSPENLATLREEFTQADAQLVKEYGGTGLGLALCYTIVGRMGGTLEIQSTLGEGTSVSLTLPELDTERS